MAMYKISCFFLSVPIGQNDWRFHVMIVIEQKVEKLRRVAGATSRTGIYTV